MSEKTRYDARKNADQAQPGYKLPTKRHLLEATGLAALMAGLLLILFILPAEYGIDPTGLGDATGLTSLSGGGAEIDLGGRAGSVHQAEPAAPRNDTITIAIAGLQDVEYKFLLDENQTMLYSWATDGASVYFDFHGEPTNGRPGEFSSYQEADRSNGSGSFQAPFTGRHGWYFQNPSPNPVTITLQTWGYYEIYGYV